MGSFSWTRHLPEPDLNKAFSTTIGGDRREYDGVTGVAHATSRVCHQAEAALLADQLTTAEDLTPHYDWSDEAARDAAHAVADRRATKLLQRLGRDFGVTTRRMQFTSGRLVSDRAGAWGGAVGNLPTAEKWGTAYAIPTADEAAFQISHRAIPVDVTQLGLPEHQCGPNTTDPVVLERLHDELVTQLGRVPRIAGIEVLDDNPRYRTSVASTDGDAVTRYRIYTRSPYGALTPTRLEPLPSMAAARATIKDLVKQTPAPSSGYDPGNVEYVAVGEKVRADGSPLILGRRDLVSRLVVYKVTLVDPKPAKTPPAVTGWTVYGVSAC